MAGTILLNGSGDVYQVEKIIIHPKDDPEENQNDLAILKTYKSFVFGINVRAIEIGPVKDGDLVVLSGWGKTEYPSEELSEKLRFLDLKVYDKTTCGLEWAWFFNITDNQVIYNTVSYEFN